VDTVPEPGVRTDAEHEACWWEHSPDGRAHCFLCPRHCRLRDGQAGFCGIRANHGGRLVALTYGRPATAHVDPIEKKPLFHFLPGSGVFSLGTTGCDLRCVFCQNWELSRAPAGPLDTPFVPPEAVVERAVELGCPSVAFTYNEPTIWGEYVCDVAAAARARGVATVLVTNGYVAPEAFADLYANVAAANVDLKAMSDDFYRHRTRARLAPVLETLRRIARETDAWLEITNLVIPSLNDGADDLKHLADWVATELGPDVPVHFTAFHPDCDLRDLPRTSATALTEARRVARAAGLRHVYEGNVPGAGSHTDCPGCGAVLVRRSWHEVLENKIVEGRCPRCRQAIAGRWESAWPGEVP
jgi:pyruvate formate lyase activating enzyme